MFTEGSVEETPISEEFERIWLSLEESSQMRGWSEGSVEAILKRLQRVGGVRVRVAPSDSAPFIGTQLSARLVHNAANSAQESLRLFWTMRGDTQRCDSKRAKRTAVYGD